MDIEIITPYELPYHIIDKRYLLRTIQGGYSRIPGIYLYDLQTLGDHANLLDLSNWIPIKDEEQQYYWLALIQGKIFVSGSFWQDQGHQWGRIVGPFMIQYEEQLPEGDTYGYNAFRAKGDYLLYYYSTFPEDHQERSEIQATINIYHEDKLFYTYHFTHAYEDEFSLQQRAEFSSDYNGVHYLWVDSANTIQNSLTRSLTKIYSDGLAEHVYTLSTVGNVDEIKASWPNYQYKIILVHRFDRLLPYAYVDILDENNKEQRAVLNLETGVINLIAVNEMIYDYNWLVRNEGKAYIEYAEYHPDTNSVSNREKMTTIVPNDSTYVKIQTSPTLVTVIYEVENKGKILDVYYGDQKFEFRLSKSDSITLINNLIIVFQYNVITRFILIVKSFRSQLIAGVHPTIKRQISLLLMSYLKSGQRLPPELIEKIVLDTYKQLKSTV